MRKSGHRFFAPSDATTKIRSGQRDPHFTLPALMIGAGRLRLAAARDKRWP
jgi:hypothetical protein